MPRIFRATRQLLIKHSNFKRYFLYAIGEIILIVIGILIALQLNNQNEIRKNKIKEQTILLSLSKGFHTNMATLDSSIITYAGYLDMIENGLNFIGMHGAQLSSGMKKNIIYNAKHIHISLVEGTLNSVLTSDNLELLKNENLKSLLTAYPSHVDEFYDTQNKLEFIIMNRHRPVLEQFISLSDILPYGDARYHIIKNKGLKSDFTGLLKSLKYQNALIDRLNMENDLIAHAKLMRLQTQKVLDVLDREIAID